QRQRERGVPIVELADRRDVTRADATKQLGVGQLVARARPGRGTRFGNALRGVFRRTGHTTVSGSNAYALRVKGYAHRTRPAIGAGRGILDRGCVSEWQRRLASFASFARRAARSSWALRRSRLRRSRGASAPIRAWRT